MSVNFDEYKAVVDYITANTGAVSASLKALIDNTIAVRSDSTLNVITSNTSIKKINLGSIVIDLTTLEWSSVSGIKIPSDDFSVVRLGGGSTIPANGLLNSVLSTDDIAEIAKSFVSKTEAASSVKHYYASTVVTFAGDEVPSMAYFFANYYSVNDIEIDKPIVISSRDINESNNIVTYAIAESISGAKVGSKVLNTNTAVFNSGLFYSDATRSEIKKKIGTVNISGSTTIETASSNKSIVIPSMLPGTIIKKDLSNVEFFSMLEADIANDSNVATPSFLEDKYSISLPVLQKDVDITKTTVNSLDHSFLSSGYFSGAGQAEADCISSIGLFNSLEDALNGDKGEVSALESVQGAFTELKSPVGIAKNRAASLKTVFAMLSAELATRYPSMMLDSVEKLALSSQLTLIVSDTDTEVFVRPILKGEGLNSDMSSFTYIASILPEVDLAGRTSRTLDGSYFG